MNTVQFHRMRILHVLGSVDRGGTETMTAQLVRHMNTAFHNELCILGGRGPVGDALDRDGLTVYYIPKATPWPLPQQASALYKILKQKRYDILHLYGLKANFLGRVLGRLSGHKRILGGLRSIYPSDSRKSWTLWFDRLTFDLSQGYVSNSQAAIDFLISHGYDRRKFWLIHNGLDIEPFCKRDHEEREEIKQRYALPPERLIIACVANLRPPKGHQYLIRALHELKGKSLDFLTLLVGDGPLSGELEELVRELGLKEKVRFLGSRDREEIPKILAITDIFVLPSLWEGLPTAIIEAMAAGCPVVATAVGGIPELIIDGETGFLVRACDPKALAQKIELLLQDQALRKKMGEAGTKRTREHFSLERMVQEYETLYKELLSSRRSHI